MAKARRANTPAASSRARSSSASRKRSSGKTTTSSSTRSKAFAIAPGTIRSLVGVGLLVVGAVTLIALAFPESGILNRYVSEFLRPWFGQGAWLLAFLLLVAGILVERAPKVGNGWGVAAIGGLIVFLGGEGLIHLLSGRGGRQVALEQGGGKVGHWLSASLTDLLGTPGAFVVLVGLIVAGVLLMFNLTLRALFRPVGAGGRVVANAATAAGAGVAAAGASVAAAATRPREDDPREVVAMPVGSAGANGKGARDTNVRPGATGPSISSTGQSADTGPVPTPQMPAPMPSPAPMSQTVWSAPASGRLAPAPAVAGVTASGTAVATALAPDAAAIGHDDAPDQPPKHRPRVWSLPTIDLLDPASESTGATRLDHQRNIHIIEQKLSSFGIPASVVGTNTGPVVTQYEVRPDVTVKLSRIEALADDLAMALAARSIRIEAPIPGRDVVGIEIPNHSSEVVGFRALYEDARMADATSRLLFALGRDVSGKPYAVDLARMPHLLIAGATGSGKSVCVNSLITSILMNATPDEVRLVLIDLKRVELASYQGLPHLMTDVIVEAHQARAALAWAVREMEDRYKLLASRAERNIAAYNASPRVAPEDRLPYVVVVIDELADLMMQEGRKVEDPVVKLAQKARAVGIHLVLATQRPSVNVVTGLIKANVPSRIAFAMASNVDSRTVLDAPGAEDLIGRGDMLYQPADLPRPVRLQGVFVSDAEVRAVTDVWREQAPEPEYDADLLAGAEGDAEDGGEFAWLAGLAEDELTPRAAELVMLTGKASTSMMQTKLKVGFNRASRLMDELERVGIVGPQDPRNPAVPRQVYGPDNWLRGPESVDQD